MNMNEYQSLAMRTKGDLSKEEMVMNSLLGINGEAGEVSDIFKKAWFQGHKLDKNKIIDELGDILWYIALMCEAYHIPLNNIAEYNIEKLIKRYPEGFSFERSINREV